MRAACAKFAPKVCKRGAKFNSAALAVAAITAGWALSRWPIILPGLTVDQAAAGHDTLVCVVVAVLAGAVILLPALVMLFRLTVSGRFRAPEVDSFGPWAQTAVAADGRRLARPAIACLVAGTGLLTVAEAPWAHAAGVAALLSFILLAFGAIAIRPRTRGSTTPRRELHLRRAPVPAGGQLDGDRRAPAGTAAHPERTSKASPPGQHWRCLRGGHHGSEAKSSVLYG
ncbi:MAG: hypothetical protein AB7U07_13190 [Thermoleophilia bacterium]